MSKTQELLLELSASNPKAREALLDEALHGNISCFGLTRKAQNELLVEACLWVELMADPEKIQHVMNLRNCIQSIAQGFFKSGAWEQWSKLIQKGCSKEVKFQWTSNAVSHTAGLRTALMEHHKPIHIDAFKKIIQSMAMVEASGVPDPNVAPLVSAALLVSSHGQSPWLKAICDVFPVFTEKTRTEVLCRLLTVDLTQKETFQKWSELLQLEGKAKQRMATSIEKQLFPQLLAQKTVLGNSYSKAVRQVLIQLSKELDNSDVSYEASRMKELAWLWFRVWNIPKDDPKARAAWFEFIENELTSMSNKTRDFVCSDGGDLTLITRTMGDEPNGDQWEALFLKIKHQAVNGQTTRKPRVL
jgi:hypothetical protein